MKNQYVGDINDYRKYGLLRILSNQGALRIALCWMLTKDDGRSDGNKTSYLKKPALWRTFDPDLFDFLQHSFQQKLHRSISSIERGTILPSTTYFSRLLTDDESERQKYFADLATGIPGTDLVFFDPDNGIEVNSVKYCKKNSCKYIYWHELKESFDAGYSLLIYQHFPRVRRDVFTKSMANKLMSRLSARHVVAAATSTVVYFLVPQNRHRVYLQRRMTLLQEQWRNNFLVTSYGK